MSRIGQGMSDGRAFTTYVSPGILNARIAQQMGFTGSEDGFRQALQKNAMTARPKMQAREPPRVPAPSSLPSKDVPGCGDMSPINCAPGFFPTVL